MRLAGADSDAITKAGGGFPAIYKALEHTSIQTMVTQASRLLRESIRQGTTTLESKSGFGVTENTEIKILRTHAVLNKLLGNVVSTFMAARFLPSLFDGSGADYVHWVCSRLLPLLRRRKLADFVDVSCEEHLFPPDQARPAFSPAPPKILGFAIKLHSGESGKTGGVRLAVELGAT